MKQIIYMLALLLAVVTNGFAQNANDKAKSKTFTVSGVVVDEHNEPYPGATIIIKNVPGRGVVSGLDGKFTIKVDPNATLVIQAVGMKTIEELVTKDLADQKFVLKEDANVVDEVVVTGLSSQKKVSVVGAISTIDPKELKAPGMSLSNMLGGRVAGVITMQTSGEPGRTVLKETSMTSTWTT